MELYEEDTFKNFNEIVDEKHSNIWSNLNDDYQKSQASSETEKVNDSFLNSGTIDESKSLKKKRKRLDTKDSDSKVYSKYSKSHLKELLKLKEIVVILKKKKE